MQNTSIPSSTGGVITFPAPGVLRHTTKSGAYSGRIAQKEGTKPAKR
jgi:hypothetical protein